MEARLLPPPPLPPRRPGLQQHDVVYPTTFHDFSHRKDTFWVSVEEAMEAFVGVGVCMLGSPGACKDRQAYGWAQEARRRVFFVPRGGSRGLGWGDGEAKEKEDGGRIWDASQFYALSVYETSRVFFSFHQVLS